MLRALHPFIRLPPASTPLLPDARKYYCETASINNLILPLPVAKVTELVFHKQRLLPDVQFLSHSVDYARH